MTPGRGVSKFFFRRGLPEISRVDACSPRRFGRGKLAYTLILFRAINDREAERGTTRALRRGVGPFRVSNRRNWASVARLETGCSVRLGFGT